MALIGLAIGAAAGLAKNYLVDAPAADRQRALAAQTQRYSPWTGNKAEAPTDPNPFSSMLQYGGAGSMMGAANKAAETDTPNPYANANAGGLLMNPTNTYNSMNPFATNPQSNFWGTK